MLPVPATTNNSTATNAKKSERLLGFFAGAPIVHTEVASFQQVCIVTWRAPIGTSVPQSYATTSESNFRSHAMWDYLVATVSVSCAGVDLEVVQACETLVVTSFMPGCLSDLGALVKSLQHGRITSRRYR